MTVTLEDFFKRKTEEETEEVQIKGIEYSRVFRVAEYESERIHVAADLSVGDDLDTCFKTLKGQVMKLHEELKTLEPPAVGIPVKHTPQIPYDFNPQEFLDYPSWKSKRNEDGSYKKGSVDWGWDFIENRDGAKNFSEAALKVLENGPVRIGDDYEVSMTDKIVQTRKIRK